MEEDLTLVEIEIALKQMKNSKSPGIDGITIEFIKAFWLDIKDLLFNAYLDCIQQDQLSPTMKTGLITLLPKPNKDLLYLDNWRPITLLCNDYKLLALVYANRIKGVLEKLVDECQSAFIKGRHIHNNIRLVLDLLDYHTFEDTENLILFVDFFKAFDSIEHNFLLETLKAFGFGDKFIQIINMFYKEIYSYVLLHPGLTPRINVSCGIRQGCPISPKLFILCTQLMASLIINNPGVEGIKLHDYEFKISQFADDTVLFLKDKSTLKSALNVISLFSEASGLHLNLKKCELLPLYECNATCIESIPVKREVKYLGLHIIKDGKMRESINIKQATENISKKLNHWLSRDLTIIGRNLLSKSEGISRMVYPSYSLYISPQNIKRTNSIIYQFIWRNKTHYVKKSQLVKEYKKGGLKTIDFEAMVGTFRINWIKHFLNTPSTIWFKIPKNIFDKVGGLSFLLRCDFEISKLPIKLSDYHKQVLHYWKMVFAHNFTPHGSTLWNNRVITINRKSLFIKKWYDNKIIFITDLLDANGQFLTLAEFEIKYNLKSSVREYRKVCEAVPVALLNLIQSYLKYHKGTAALPKIQLNHVSLNDKKCNNKIINGLFKSKLFHGFETEVIRKVGKITLKHMDFMKWPIPPKIKEMQFKIINGYYPSAATLQKRFGFEVEPCGFCLKEEETIEHLFFSCRVSKDFWNLVIDWLKIKMENIGHVDIEQILYGTINISKNTYTLFNMIIIMGKYHIHKCKWGNKNPCFVLFKSELQTHFASLYVLKEYEDLQQICENVSKYLTF